jgi:CHAD domain-containing protein
MQYIHPDIGIQFKTVIEQQVNSAMKLLHDSKLEPKNKVRELRRNIKNVRSVFKLFKPVIAEIDFHTIDKHIGSVNRSLTIQREAAVNLKTYHSIEKYLSDKLSAQTNTFIIEALKEHFNEVYSNKDNAFEKLMLNCSFQLSKLRERINLLASRNYSESLLYMSLEKTFSKTVRLYLDSKKSLQTNIIHEWKISNKHLTTQLQFADIFHVNMFNALIDELEIITDTLGRDHDLAVLHEFIFGCLKVKISKKELSELQLVIDTARRKLQKEAFIKGNIVFSTRFNIPKTEKAIVF